MLRSVKERVRHALHVTGLKRRPAYLRGSTVEDRFTAIYADGVWTLGDAGVPLSGTGSTLEATAPLRERLPAFLDEVGADALVDVGCGDFSWMRSTPIDQCYVGVDVVPGVIEQNQRLYGNDRRTFMLGDATAGDLPAGDVVLCREVLFHLSFAHGLATLRNILSKPRRFLILTSDRDTSFNSDIETGAFRLLNLEKRPYHLGPPIERIEDGTVAPGRFMGIWNAEQLRHLKS